MARTPAIAPERLQLLMAYIEAAHGLDAVTPQNIRAIVGAESAGSQTTLQREAQDYRERRQAQLAAAGDAHAAHPLEQAARVRLGALAEQFFTELVDVIQPGFDLRDRAIAELDATIEQLRGELADAEAARAEAAQRCEALEGELQGARQAAEAAQAEQAEIERARAQTQQRLDAEQEARKEAEGAHREAERRHEATEQARADRAERLAAEQQRRQEDVAALRQELDSEREGHQATAGRLDRQEQRANELQAELDAQRQKNEDLSGSLQDVRAELTAATNQAEAAEARRQDAEDRAQREAQRTADTQTAMEETRAAAAAERDEERQERRAAETRQQEMAAELREWQRAYRELIQRMQAGKTHGEGEF